MITESHIKAALDGTFMKAVSLGDSFSLITVPPDWTPNYGSMIRSGFEKFTNGDIEAFRQRAREIALKRHADKIASRAAPPSAWTDDMMKQARELKYKGYTASQIAEKLGHGITRGAVCGKLFRAARRWGKP